MATNQIGSKTANLTVNVPTEEREELVKAAHAFGARSANEFVRALLLIGLEHYDGAAAERVRKIRREYYGIFSVV